jgi:rhodanese-related sulfurtransferase
MGSDPMPSARDVYDTKDSAQILDVREPYEWEAGHVEGSVHLPLAQVMSGGEQDRVSRDRPVLVICRSGNRSELAALMLQARGIDATNVEGGLEEWEREGLPLVDSNGNPGRVA